MILVYDCCYNNNVLANAHINMNVIEIFSSSADYKYKTRICSLSFFVVIFLFSLVLITPFFIIYNTGGFWLRNRIHVEAPDVTFQYKYLLIAEKDIRIDPVICSTFTRYKENIIPDDCTLIKVEELDTNRDGKKDTLTFSAYFYTTKALKTIKLLLFFNFRLQQLFEETIQSVAIFDHVLNQEVQKVQFVGDLMLVQKGVLHGDHLYEAYNHSIELGDQSLSEFIMYNANKKFLAKITNVEVITQTGYSSDKTTEIQGKISYAEHLIHYQPRIWEELKWAWIQYLSCLFIFAYLANHILIFLFTNRYLNSYIVVPWKNK